MRLLVVRRLQSPPVIAMQLGALGWMDAPAEWESWVTEEQRTRMGISTGEGGQSVQGAVSRGRGEALHIMLIRGKFCSRSHKKKKTGRLQ